MKIIVLCLLLGTTLGAPEKDLTIKEFEEKFHQKFADPKDEADAAKELALKAKICSTGPTIRHIRHCIQMF